MAKAKRKSREFDEDDLAPDRRKDQDKRKAKRLRNAIRVKDVDYLLELEDD